MLYTDYNYALMYHCKEFLLSGKCVPTKESVGVLSRDGHLPEDELRHLVGVVEKACLVEDDFVFVDRTGEGLLFLKYKFSSTQPSPICTTTW